MSTIKYIAIILLCAFSAQAENTRQLIVYGVDAQNQRVLHDNHDFYILTRGQGVKKIQKAFIDPHLRSVTTDQLQRFADHGFLTACKMSNGEYSLKSHVRGLGGGPGGATAGAYFGKFIVHFAAHSTILAVGYLTGPAAPATIASLEATFLPAIESASMASALGFGILGAVITGPA